MTTPESAYRDFHQHLSRYIKRRLGNADDVPDILHEVFVRVLRNAPALSEAREPLAWLYTVTKSVLVDHFRKNARQIPGHIEMPRDTPRDTPDGLDPEFGKCVGPLLDGLPEQYRNAVKFTDLDGGKQTEFARISGQSISAVKSQVQRGRRMLKDAILGCCNVDLDNNNRVMDVYPDVKCADDCC